MRSRDDQVVKGNRERSESSRISRRFVLMNRNSVLPLARKCRALFNSIAMNARVSLAILVGREVIVLGLNGDADVVVVLAPAAGPLLWSGSGVGLAQDALGDSAIGSGSGGHSPSQGTQFIRRSEPVLCGDIFPENHRSCGDGTPGTHRGWAGRRYRAAPARAAHPIAIQVAEAFQLGHHLGNDVHSTAWGAPDPAEHPDGQLDQSCLRWSG
jgi:hypothetical protein